MKTIIKRSILALLIIALSGSAVFLALNIIKQNNYNFTADTLPKIDGSTSTKPLTTAVVAHLLKIPTEQADAMFVHNKTDLSYRLLFEKQSDIIFVTEPSRQELDEAERSKVELSIVPVVKEGFVFITHKDNPVDSLTIEQIQDIYQGKITNWSEVSGEDKEILAYRRNVDSGSESLMTNLVMKDLPMAAPAPDMLVISMSGLISAVAEYENDASAIGYSVYYYASLMEANPNIKFIKVNGVLPTNETIANESYPLSTNYYMVTRKGIHSSNLTSFMKWLQTSEAKTVFESAGYIPIR